MKKFILVIPAVILVFGLNFFQTSDSNYKPVKDLPVHNMYTYQIIDRECSFCHNDKLKHNVMHAPVTDDCETCHQTTGEKHPRAKLRGFELAEKTPDLCYICHEAKNDKKNIHAPVDGDCSSCHSSHGSEYQYLLAKPTSSLVCAECHDLDFNENMNIHAPIELDGCQSCHDSHQSDYSYLLIEEKSKLCITCHDNIEIEKQEKYIHAPFEDDCSNCHNPHSSKEDHLLNMNSSDLCFSCHDDIGFKLKKSKYTHGIINNKNNCHDCHSPHASSHNKLLVKEQSDLCFNCHNEEIKTSSKTIENIKETIQKSKYKHAAIEGGCNTCHDPHASDNNSILIGAFPSEEYVKASVETFELCFNCHDSDLLEKEFSTTATNFRNKNQNLHFVHINGDKGRNCNICHDMHASKNKYLIKKRVKYGSWDMPMNFLLKENGASCRTGCHTEKEYNRLVIEKIENKDTTAVVGDTSIVDTVHVAIEDTISEHIVKVNIIKDTLIEDSNIVMPDTTSISNAADTIINIKDKTIIDSITNKEIVVIIPLDTLIDDNTVIINDTFETKQIETVSEIINNIDNNDLAKNEKMPVVDAFKEISQLHIFFKFDSRNLAKNADDEIQKLLVFMKHYADVTIQINGHTDSIGSQPYNIDLSKRRANAIQKILISKGILPKRIIIKGKGENYPIDSNKTEEGRANNRRVEFKLLTN